MTCVKAQVYDTILIFTLCLCLPVWSKNPTVNGWGRSTDDPISLSSHSYSCVIFSWDQLGPFDDTLLGYKYKCPSTADWIEVGLQVSSRQVCGFQPNQEVECKVTAVVTEDSITPPVYTRYTTTRCAAPVLPADLSRYVTEEAYLPNASPYHKRRLFIQVPISDITVNCDSIITESYWIMGRDKVVSPGEMLDNLDAISSYRVVYQVINNQGISSINRSVSVTTGELEPSEVVNLLVQPLNISCVNVWWDMPLSPNGVITKYEWRCATAESVSNAEYAETMNTELYAYSCGYAEDERVSCEVRASTSIGPGPSVDSLGATACTSPSRPIVNVSDEVQQSNSSMKSITVEIFYKVEYSNCVAILSYSVVITTEKGGFRAETVSNQTRLIYENLQPYTTYNINVEVTNDAKLSASTDTLILTSEVEPTSPPFLQLSFNTACVSLKLAPPDQSNGIIGGYEYACTLTSEEQSGQRSLVLASNTTMVSPYVCGFMAASEVICIATAFNIAGSSPSISMKGYTSLELTEPLQSSDLVEIEDDGDKRTIKVKVKPLTFKDLNIMPSSYLIVVGQLANNSYTEDDPQFYASNLCNLSNLQEHTIAKSSGSSCYITAKVPAMDPNSDGIVITLGDSTPIGGYYNIELKNDTRYWLTVSAVITVQEKEHSYPLRPHIFDSSPITPDAACSTACVVGIIVAGILLVLIAIGIGLWLYWKKRLPACLNSPPKVEAPTGRIYEQVKEVSSENTKKQVIHPIPPGINNQFSDIQVYDSGETDRQNANIILATAQVEVTTPAEDENKDRLREEFLGIEKKLNKIAAIPRQSPPTQDPKKIRYAGTVCPDEYLVQLSSGGYVHAVYLNSFEKENHIIATQLPTKNTITDFWEMIRENNVTAIVQLEQIEGEHGIMYGAREEVEFTDCKEGEHMINQACILHGKPLTIFKIRTLDKDKSSLWLPEIEILLRYANTLTKHQEAAADEKICVISKDSISRCGLFIAAFNILQQFKTGKSPALCDVVWDIRKRQRKFLEAREEYAYLDKLVTHLTSQFPDYETFNYHIIPPGDSPYHF